ncbi:hypothetical protein P692DRAFT_20821323 [Suillus brevipes Sb2]|nr:hypothetical protein P692DRAFT_20821323 [Suillus brevipes Sb2]
MARNKLSYLSDHVRSNDMEEILEMTLIDQRPVAPVRAAGPSKLAKTPSYIQKHGVNTRLSSLEVEIQGIDEQIKTMTALRGTLITEKDDLTRERSSRMNLVQPSRGNDAVQTKGKSKAATVDYTVDFDWSTQLQLTMKKVFSISHWTFDCARKESVMPMWMAEILRWQVINLSTSCPPDARVYTGGISPHIPDDGLDSTSERVRSVVDRYDPFPSSFPNDFTSDVGVGTHIPRFRTRLIKKNGHYVDSLVQHKSKRANILNEFQLPEDARSDSKTLLLVEHHRLKDKNGIPA